MRVLGRTLLNLWQAKVLQARPERLKAFRRISVLRPAETKGPNQFGSTAAPHSDQKHIFIRADFPRIRLNRRGKTVEVRSFNGSGQLPQLRWRDLAEARS